MKRLSITLLLAGALLLLVGLLLTLLAGAAAMPSYLADWLFWSALPLGALPLVMLLDLIGPSASLGLEPALRRLLLLLPLAAILVIPILARPHELFGWAMGHGFTTPFGKAWMRRWPFVARNIVYFLLWIALALGFTRPPARNAVPRRQGLAAFGLLVYALSAMPAAADWAVAVEPNWISAEYPLLLLATQATIAVSVAVLLAGAAWRQLAPTAAAAFLLTASGAWVFLEFMQFLVIWSADKMSDIAWYLHRWSTASGIAVVVAMLGGFLVPMLVLLSPALRRRPRALPVVAVLMLCAQALNALWLITPSLRHHFTVSGMDVLEFAALGGVTLGALLWPVSRSEAALHG